MPNNLHAFIRYRTIDECLRRTNRRWSIEDLAAACGEALRKYHGTDLDDPSRRIIFYDLKFMKDSEQGFGAPIEYVRREKSYRYTRKDFSIFHNPLRPKELVELQHALNILRQFRGFQHLKGLENIITKLEHSMLASAGNAVPVIQFDHPVDAPGQQYLNQLFNYIRQRQAINLTYQPFHFDTPMGVIISPLLLKEYNKRWFLFGYNHEVQLVSTFPLDRIRDVKKSLQPYRDTPYFHPDTYFNNIIGVSFPEEGRVETIEFAVYDGQVKYVVTKPLHPSQRIVREEAERTVFSLQLIPNYELESLLLSFGERLEVLGPGWLLKKIRGRIDEMRNRYF